MIKRRYPVLLGVMFIVDGIVYALIQGKGSDLTGAVALVGLGIAMAFTFMVLFNGISE